MIDKLISCPLGRYQFPVYHPLQVTLKAAAVDAWAKRLSFGIWVYSYN
jgi:hypothetical protein